MDINVTTEDLYGNIKRISDEELEKLWYKYLSDRTNLKLRDELIVQYIYLAKYVIARIKLVLTTSYSADDITSFAIEGLMNAIDRFSPEKGARFETYAVMRIRGTIIDRVRELDWVPRSIRQKQKEISKAIDSFFKRNGRMPSKLEIAAELGIEYKKLESILLEDGNILSLYDKKYIGNDNSVDLIDTIVDDIHANPDQEVSEKDTKKELEKALNKLPERERMIMVLYYHENMTLKEIGKFIDVSESRVCQIHAQAIMKLRTILSRLRGEKKHTSRRIVRR